MSDPETLLYSAADGVATIALNRPEKRNAMNRTLFEELGEATERAARDPDVRVVLVRGEGPSFCAGIDVTSFGELAGAGPTGFRGFIRMAQRPYLNLQTMPKPVVAAVQGHALGAGFQLALACDLRLVATDVSMGMLEIRFGIVPDLGGNRPLAALVGPAVAKELVWTGRTVEAAEAERLGLANRVVDPEALRKEAEALAAELASRPPLPMAFTKGIIGRATETPIETVMEQEGQAQITCLTSEDHREAVAAYFEKRPGRFQGR